MNGESETRCSECGSELHSGDKFCSECGQPAPAVSLDEPEATTEESEPDSQAQAPSKKRNGKPILITAIAALGLILAAGAFWGLTRDSLAETQYEVSAPVLLSTLDDMSTAQSSPTVREIAGNADTELSTITTTLESDPQADGADRLTTMRNAFASVAALQNYRVENTEVWKDNRSDLQNNLDTLSTYGGSTQNAAVAGDDATRTLNDLTRRIDKAMRKYHKQVRKAREQARSERESVRAYHSSMEYLIDQYTYLRNDTGDFVDRMAYEDMYMVEVIDYFTQASTDRREILNSMAQLSPPAQMTSAHSQIETALGDGADAIDAAVAALEDADCFDGECYFEYNTQWQQFETESDRITQRYGDAYDAWKAAMARTERQTGKADLPDKPDL